MGRLDEQIAKDATYLIDSGTGFGEPATYTKSALAGGATRSITAIVERNSPRPQSGVDQSMAPMIIAYVQNSATTGITWDELDTGGDTLTIAKRPGGSETVAYGIHLPPSGMLDSGMLRLELS